MKEGLSLDRLSTLIDSEVKRRQDENYTSAFFISDFKIDVQLFKAFPYEIEYLEFVYMTTSTATANRLSTRQDFSIQVASSQEILNDGIAVDITANTIHMGDFAKERIQRKAEIYRNNELKTKLYVGYYNNLPIGNCELFIHKNISKLEDFDIIEAYQRKGFGTHFLNYLLHETEKYNIQQLYLVTDNADTAKEMYKKNHFDIAGYKYEVYIDFKKPK